MAIFNTSLSKNDQALCCCRIATHNAENVAKVSPLASGFATKAGVMPILARAGRTMTLTLTRGMQLVAATHNPGKAVELAALLDGRFDLIAAGALGVPEPDETESTFAGNAILKARHAAEKTGLAAIADDSGLSVTALGGAPGIFSARWAGPEKDFSLAMRKVEERLEEAGGDDRSAWFTCALAVAWPQGPAVVFEGRIDGTLTFPPRGMQGFGYDPIFIPQGFSETFGEMVPARKDAMSHRARAFAQLKAVLFD